MLESRASANGLAMHSTIKGRERVQSELATTPLKLQAPKRALIAASDHLKRHYSTFQVAEAAVQEGMKSNFPNHIQVMFDQVNQSAEANELNVRGYFIGDGAEASYLKHVRKDYRAT